MCHPSVPHTEILFESSLLTKARVNGAHFHGYLPTVQTFNSCTSRPDVYQCLVVQTPIGNMLKNMPKISMTLVACESKPGSFVKSPTHPYPGNPVAIGRAVVYYARAAHVFTAGIKCWHCMWYDGRHPCPY